MTIIPSANCSTASCPVDLNPGCPQQLLGPRDSSKNLVGCNSACVANLDNASACLSPSPLVSSIRSSFIIPPPGPRNSTHVDSQFDLWAFGAQNSQFSQLLHGLPQHRNYLPGLWRAVLLLLQCVPLAPSSFLMESQSKQLSFQMQRAAARIPMHTHMMRARERHCGHAIRR
jgi:hypothetical protein